MKRARRWLALLIDPSLSDELAWGLSSNRAAWKLYRRWSAFADWKHPDNIAASLAYTDSVQDESPE